MFLMVKKHRVGNLQTSLAFLDIKIHYFLVKNINRIPARYAKKNVGKPGYSRGRWEVILENLRETD